jgi:hypothetical protein
MITMPSFASVANGTWSATFNPTFTGINSWRFVGNGITPQTLSGPTTITYTKTTTPATNNGSSGSFNITGGVKFGG